VEAPLGFHPHLHILVSDQGWIIVDIKRNWKKVFPPK